jgi:hypothetical protein
MTSLSLRRHRQVQASGLDELDGRASLPYQGTGVWVGDQVTAAGEAITMWARVAVPARHGAGWPSPKSQHGLGRQEGLMS